MLLHGYEANKNDSGLWSLEQMCPLQVGFLLTTIMVMDISFQTHRLFTLLGDTVILLTQNPFHSNGSDIRNYNDFKTLYIHVEEMTTNSAS